MSRRTVQQAVADYLIDKADIRAASLHGYRQNLTGVFLPWCEEAGIVYDSDVNRRVLLRFVEHLKLHGGKKGRLSEQSIATYSKSCQQFLNWLDGTGRKRERLTPKVKHIMRDILEPGEIDRMEDAARTERDKVIIRLLASTGMRLGELCALKGKHILRVHGGDAIRIPREGKSGERENSLRPELAKRLRKLSTGAEEPIFTQNKREMMDGKPTGRRLAITPSGVRQVVHFLALEAGVAPSKRVYPHIFRHTFITQMWAKHDASKVAKWVGHSNTAMLERVYGHLKGIEGFAAMLADIPD